MKVFHSCMNFGLLDFKRVPLVRVRCRVHIR